MTLQEVFLICQTKVKNHGFDAASKLGSCELKDGICKESFLSKSLEKSDAARPAEMFAGWQARADCFCFTFFTLAHDDAHGKKQHEHCVALL